MHCPKVSSYPEPHPSSMPNDNANNRGITIKGYAFVLLFKTKVGVCVCMCVYIIRIWMMENYIS